MTIRKLKNLATIISKKYNLLPIKIRFKEVRKGFAYISTRKITIPIWIFETVKVYQYYYIIHELTHFILHKKFGHEKHGKEFKKIESQILKEYNIIPVYSRAYAKALYNLEGKKLCGRLGVK